MTKRRGGRSCVNLASARAPVEVLRPCGQEETKRQTAQKLAMAARSDLSRQLSELTRAEERDPVLLVTAGMANRRNSGMYSELDLQAPSSSPSIKKRDFFLPPWTCVSALLSPGRGDRGQSDRSCKRHGARRAIIFSELSLSQRCGDVLESHEGGTGQSTFLQDHPHPLQLPCLDVHDK